MGMVLKRDFTTAEFAFISREITIVSVLVSRTYWVNFSSRRENCGIGGREEGREEKSDIALGKYEILFEKNAAGL